VADDQASNGRRHNNVAFGKVRRQFASEFLGDRRMLQDQRALHILVGMKAAGQPEMTF
jgi:hypothetical protein